MRLRRAARGEGFTIQPRSRLLTHPLLATIATLFVVDGALALLSRDVIRASSFRYLALGHYPLAAVFLIAGVLGAIAILTDHWLFALPQEALLVVSSAGVVAQAAAGHISVQGAEIPVSWERALAGGVSVIVLAGFHTVALGLMISGRARVYTFVRAEVDRQADVLALASSRRTTLRNVREINDAIMQETVVAKALIESGINEEAVAHLAEAVRRTQELMTELLHEAGFDRLPPGEARIESA